MLVRTEGYGCRLCIASCSRLSFEFEHVVRYLKERYRCGMHVHRETFDTTNGGLKYKSLPSKFVFASELT